MAFETRLSPPVINSKLPAFAGMSINIPFTISKAVSSVDFSNIAIKIKTVQTNVEKVTYITNSYYYDSAQHIYVLSIDLDAYNNSVANNKKFIPQVGQYYKVQIALVTPSGVPGYYSTVGVAKCTAEPTVIIKDREKNGEEVKFHTYQYTGLYSQENGDSTEKVYSYRFDLYDEQNRLVGTSGDLIHNNANDEKAFESSDTWTVRKNLDPNVPYEIEYTITTVNGLERSSGRYQIIEASTALPNVHAELSAINHYEDGYIRLTLVGDKSGSFVNGRFVLMRASSEDLYDSWYELTNFDLSQYDSSTNKLLCKDYTVRQGISYRYAIRAYTPQQLFSDRLMNKEGPVLCDFEDAFLYDGERQLKIRFNPKVSSFKSTVLETKTDTIGGKYPFIFRNGNVEYKEFGISGLISLLSDENNEFLSDLTPKNEDIQNGFQHWLTTDNIRKEREFKMLVLSWLTNGKPKLFRSPVEGNFIVRLMNTSLSPNDQLNRMLHTFNCTAYEIADYNFDTLKDYGFATKDYTETRTIKINQEVITAKGMQLTPVQPAVYCSVSGEPLTIFHYMLKGKSELQQATIGLTGSLTLSEKVLMETPLTKIILPSKNLNNENINADKDRLIVTYGYYDDTAHYFSIVHDIRLSDKIVQLIGAGFDNNLIRGLEDMRLSTGAFPYIRIQPREIVKILQRDNKYYYNNNNKEVLSLNPNFLYYIYVNNFDSVNLTEYYFDGQDININSARRKKIKEIDYNFHISGMKEGQVIDFNGQGKTSGSYDALTGIGKLSELYAGDGLILDIIYQQREQIFVTEVDGEYYDVRVVSAKNAWIEEEEKYQGMVAANIPIHELNQQKEKVNKAYELYLYWLTLSINNLKEVYGIEYAI